MIAIKYNVQYIELFKIPRHFASMSKFHQKVEVLINHDTLQKQGLRFPGLTVVSPSIKIPHNRQKEDIRWEETLMFEKWSWFPRGREDIQREGWKDDRWELRRTKILNTPSKNKKGRQRNLYGRRKRARETGVLDSQRHYLHALSVPCWSERGRTDRQSRRHGSHPEDIYHGL